MSNPIVDAPESITELIDEIFGIDLEEIFDLSTEEKLKAASLLQTMATIGTGMGAHIPYLAKWGEGNQMLIANQARALQQKLAEEIAKKKKKGGFFGSILGTLGLIGGSLLSPVAGAVLGGLGSVIGQEVGGGEVSDYSQPFNMILQGLSTGYGASTYAASENRTVNIGDVLRTYTGVGNNQTHSWQPYYVTNMNGAPVVLSANPLSMYLLNKSNKNP